LDIKLILAILSSSVISSLITAIFTKRSNDQNQQVKYITQERQEWRKEIRDKITAFCNTTEINEMKEYRTYLFLRLNPIDKKDIAIIELMSEIIDAPDDETKKHDLQWKAAALLKHDWERAKREVKFPTILIKPLLITLGLYGYYLCLVKNILGGKIDFQNINLDLFMRKNTVYIVCLCLFLMIFNFTLKTISRMSSLKFKWLNNLFNIRN
jgi:hypothetical protein